MYDSTTLDDMPLTKQSLLGKEAAPPAPPAAASNLKVTLVLVVVQAIWSLNAVYAKVGLRDMHVMVWYSLRLIFATPVFFALAFAREREALFSARPIKDWLWLGLLGMLGMVFNQLLFLNAIALTTATNAGMVSPAISVFSMAISALLCYERLSLPKVGGIAVTVLGALIILEVEKVDMFGSNDVLLGNLLAVSSTVCFSFFIVLQKPLHGRVTPGVLNFCVFAVGLVVIAPTTLIAYWDEVVDVVLHAPLNAYLSTLYSALIAGVVGYNLNTWAIYQIPASTVALFYCLQALMIALFAWLFLGEQLTLRVAFGGLLIMAGLISVTWALEHQRKKDQAHLHALVVVEEEEEEEGLKKGLLLPHTDPESVPPPPGSGADEADQKKSKKEAEYGTFV